MAEIYLAIAAFIVALMVIGWLRLYLPAFFFVCYMLPFFPVFAALLQAEVPFWNTERFVYDVASPEVVYVSEVWLVSSIGVILGALLSFVVSSYSPSARGFVGSEPPGASGEIRVPVRELMVFPVAAVLVVARAFMGEGLARDWMAGAELLICVVLLLCLLVALSRKRTLLQVLAVSFVTVYVASQLQSGDRDFVVIVIALMLWRLATRSPTRAILLAAGLAGGGIFVLGAVVSMQRMGVELSATELKTYLLFNSWNATILPVLLMVEAEWETGPLLYGKTYVDLLTSVIPSVVFAAFGAEKPIQVDNPALWFYIEGLGGMHASGVALRNFGAVGVLLQCSVFVLALCKLERFCVRTRTPLAAFLFLTVAAAIMHTVWYSLVSMVNALLLFAVLGYLVYANQSPKAPGSEDGKRVEMC